MKKVLLFIGVLSTVHLAIGQKHIQDNFLKYLGDSVVVTGKIYGGAFLTHVVTRPTFLNLGDTSPVHRLMIRIEPEDRDKFPEPPEVYFLNKNISVSGVLQDYKGTALIKISRPEMIKPAALVTDSNALKPNITYINKFANEAKNTDAGNKKLLVKQVNADSILQSNWIKSVTRNEAEQVKINVRVVQKEMPLRTAPSKEAPVIATLHKGMQISIIYVSKKWSYIRVASVDGYNSVSGFIRIHKFRHLKKVK